MLARTPPPENPDVKPTSFWGLGQTQALALSVFTTAGSWAANMIDWRGFLAVNLPLAGQAVFAWLRGRSYRPVGAGLRDEDSGV